MQLMYADIRLLFFHPGEQRGSDYRLIKLHVIAELYFSCRQQVICLNMEFLPDPTAAMPLLDRRQYS